MSKNEFAYVTYIRTTPEKLWAAITQPEFTRQYWGGMENESDWKPGSKWQHVGDSEDHKQRVVRVAGKVEESKPPTRLVLTWAEPGDTTDVSRVTFEIEQFEEMVQLKVIHGDFTTASTMAAKVSQGWPRVLSSLKSFLETGKALNVMCGKPKCS